MSYLLRALKKSQTDRGEEATAEAGSVAYLPHVTPPAPTQTRAFPVLLVSNGILLALIVFSLTFLYFRWADERDRGEQLAAPAGNSDRAPQQQGASTDAGNPGVPSENESKIGYSAEGLARTAVADASDQTAHRPSWVMLKAVSGRGVPVDHMWRPGLEPAKWETPTASRFGPPQARFALSPLSGRIPRPNKDFRVARSVQPESTVLTPEPSHSSTGPSEQAPRAADRPQVQSPHDVASSDQSQAPALGENLDALQAAVAQKSEEFDPAVGIPRMEQLPISVLRELPELAISVHAYDPDPEKRFVRLNRAKRKASDRIAEDLWLREITPEGVVLRYRETDFLLRAN